MMNKNSMTIGVIGLGYVGLPLAKAFNENSVRVIGFDVDQAKVNSLNSGTSPLDIYPNTFLRKMLSKKLFKASSNFKDSKLCDAIIICVPTPLDAYHQPDLSFVTESVKSIAKYVKDGAMISLESTTYPGTTKDIVKPILESFGKKVGRDIFLCYSPEREDPGNEAFTLKNTPKVISGYTKKCLSRAKLVYSIVCEDLVSLPSLEAAELCKLIENIQRSVNIGLMNELRFFAEKANINLFQVIDAAATKPFGFTPYYPGPGVGGHCIPIDPFYLTYKAKEYGIHTKFIELAGEVNESMPEYITRRVGDELNKLGKSLKHSNILCIGLSYKKNVGDCRESPSVEIFNNLITKGAKVSYHDPFVDRFPKMRNFNIKSKSVPLVAKNIQKFDVVVVNVLHDEINMDLIYQNSRLIIDSSGAFRFIVDSKKKIISI